MDQDPSTVIWNIVNMLCGYVLKLSKYAKVNHELASSSLVSPPAMQEGYDESRLAWLATALPPHLDRLGWTALRRRRFG